MFSLALLCVLFAALLGVGFCVGRGTWMQIKPDFKNPDVIIGSRIELLCTVWNHPAKNDTIKWVPPYNKDTASDTREDGNHIQNKDGTFGTTKKLLIKSFSKEHAGTFKCVYTEGSKGSKRIDSKVTLNAVKDPYIRINRGDKVLHPILGWSLTLTCIAHLPFNNYSLRWSTSDGKYAGKVNGIRQYGPKILIDGPDIREIMNLTFQAFRGSHDGDYDCIIDPAFETGKVKARVSLTGINDPAVEIKPNVTDLLVIVGSTQTVVCTLVNHPREDDRVKWTSEGVSLAGESDKSYVHTPDGLFTTRLTMIFYDLGEDSKAVYKCSSILADYSTHRTEKRISITAIDEPVIKIKPDVSFLLAIAGARLRVTCTVHHHPNEHDSIVWVNAFTHANTTDVRNETVDRKINSDGTVTTQTELIIDNFKEGHIGDYTCELTPAFTPGEYETRITLREMNAADITVKITPTDQDLEPGVGTSQTLFCHVTHHPTKDDTITWNSPYDPMFEPDERVNVSQVTNPDGSFTSVRKLVIESFNEQHSGTYECVLTAAYSDTEIKTSVTLVTSGALKLLNDVFGNSTTGIAVIASSLSLFVVLTFGSVYLYKRNMRGQVKKKTEDDGHNTVRPPSDARVEAEACTESEGCRIDARPLPSSEGTEV